MPTTIPIPGPQEVYLKGAGFDACVLYADEKLGRERATAIVRRMEAATGPLRPHRLASSRVPLGLAARFFHEVAQTLGGTFDSRRQALGEMGAFVAEHNLHGVFKVVLSFVGSPERLARRLPSMWTTYFPNVEVEMDLERLGQRELRFVVRGLTPLHYVNAVAAGWLVYAFRLVGAATVEVEEAGLQRQTFTPDGPLEYVMRWT